MGSGDSKFSSSSTAQEVADTSDLKGNTVFITGANTGIGKETARAMATRGADVIIGCRSVERGQKAIEDIKTTLPEAKLRCLALDLSSLASVERCVGSYLALNEPLHILINNAGIMMLPDFQTTAEGHEKQWGVNHLGHFHLTTLLADKLVESAPSRVVNLSSSAHQFIPSDMKVVDWMPPTKAQYSAQRNYGLSKASNILFSKGLVDRFESKGVTSYAVHPGVIPTELGRNSTLANIFYTVGSIFMKNIPQGAATTVYCAVMPREELTPGQLYADCAEWEPNAASSSPANVQALWAISEQLVTDYQNSGPDGKSTE